MPVGDSDRPVEPGDGNGVPRADEREESDVPDPVPDPVVDWRAVMGEQAPPGPGTGTGRGGDEDEVGPGQGDPDHDHQGRDENQDEDDENFQDVAGDTDPGERWATGDTIPMKKIAQIAAVLVGLYLVVNFLDVWIASASSYDGTAQAAVVLGAAQYNGEPSEALQGRLDQAATLYRDQRVGLVVVTGGGRASDITTEAKTGYNYLRDTASIPDEDLRLEVDGTSTYLSLAAAARFLLDEGITDVVLVTDPYHAKRSKLIANEVGLDAEVSPTDSSTSLTRLIKESGAIAVGRILGFRRLDAYVDL